MSEKKRTERPISNNGIGQIPERLRILVNRSSIRALAKKSGVSGGTIHNYLDGKSMGTLNNLSSIAAAADVSLEWVITGKEAMQAAPAGEVQPTVDFDRAMFTRVLAGIETGLQETRYQLAPEKKVELALALYDIFKDSDKEPSTATILPFLRVGAK